MSCALPQCEARASSLCAMPIAVLLNILAGSCVRLGQDFGSKQCLDTGECTTDADDGKSNAGNGCPAEGIIDYTADSTDADGTDADGTDADGCEVHPGTNTFFDSDSDGMPDGVDVCPGFDDRADSDSDTHPDGCDAYPGTDNRLDSDRDGVPDGVDVCPGFDDHADSDSDTHPDGCDAYPGTDNRLDSDKDGVPDGVDVCPGFDDSVDLDSDTVPDGCDTYPGADNRLDSDGDAVPDGADVCPGSDDRADSDNDTVPDGCDGCPGLDDTTDSNGDDYPDCCTTYAGLSGRSDSDGDGYADGCDLCPGQPDDGKPFGSGELYHLLGMAADSSHIAFAYTWFDNSFNRIAAFLVDNKGNQIKALDAPMMAGHRSAPDLAFLATGNFVISYNDHWGSASLASCGLYMGLYNPTDMDNPLISMGSSKIAQIQNADTVNASRIVSLDADGYVVAYVNNYDSNRLHFRYFNNDGTPRAANQKVQRNAVDIAGYSPAAERSLDAVRMPDNNIAIVYTPNSTTVRFNYFPTFSFNDTITATQPSLTGDHASVDALPSGGIALAWHRPVSGTETATYLQFFDSVGAPTSGLITVDYAVVSNTAGFTQTVTVDSNTVLVAWLREGTLRFRFYDIDSKQPTSEPLLAVRPDSEIAGSDGDSNGGLMVKRAPGGGLVAAWTKRKVGVRLLFFDSSGKCRPPP